MSWTPSLAAAWAVDERDEMVAAVVERVRDWETATLMVRGIMKVWNQSSRGLRTVYPTIFVGKNFGASDVLSSRYQ